MKFTTYAENTTQLNQIAELFDTQNTEVIVSHTQISRVSQTSKEELLAMVALNQKLKLNLVLEWDVLKQDSLFKKIASDIETLPLHEFKAIRVQDPGALHFVKEKIPWLKVQLILENGNHNLTGLLRWQEFLGDQLDRLVLSNELSKDHLKSYAAILPGKLEILTFGRILLFYSPRLLLSPLSKNEIEHKTNELSKNFEAFGTSEESPHAGFPLIENQHGTFMFNVKDLFLLDHMEEIRALNVGAVRVDLRFDESFKHLPQVSKVFKGESVDLTKIKTSNVRPVIKGFYNINKTDVLFSKLKNKRIARNDESYLGEIVDVERDHSMALLIKSKQLSLKAGMELKILTPEGKEKVITAQELLSTSGTKLTEVKMNEVVLLHYVRGVVGKSQVYLNSKT
jgi:putative protease